MRMTPSLARWLASLAPDDAARVVDEVVRESRFPPLRQSAPKVRHAEIELLTATLRATFTMNDGELVILTGRTVPLRRYEISMHQPGTMASGARQVIAGDTAPPADLLPAVLRVGRLSKTSTLILAERMFDE